MRQKCNATCESDVHDLIAQEPWEGWVAAQKGDPWGDPWDENATAS